MDRSKYPANWTALSELVRARAGQRCQFCGAENGVVGVRLESGLFVSWEDCENGAPEILAGPIASARAFRLVLTVAHLDHDTAHNAPENLRALCQRCHLVWDRHHHARTASLTRDRKRRQMRFA